VIIADGARYAAKTSDRYDVVIIDSTDPLGPGAVLFTTDFYTSCRRLLRSGGVMATQCGNTAIKPHELVETQRDQRAAGFALVDYYLTIVPTYIGGAMALGFASDDPSRRQWQLAELEARMPKGLRYYTPKVHDAAFAHQAWMIDQVGY
jgi:spermidine synthase